MGASSARETFETGEQAYLASLLPNDIAHDLTSSRIIDLVRKGLKNPRGVSVAEVYELCRSIHDSELDLPRS